MQFNHPMRAVVLDDLPEEAILLMRAFGKMGIPSVHFSPDDLEELDEEEGKRPTGVRLLGLDLDLLREGTTNIKNAVGSITRLLRPVALNGPFGLIVWSNHPDEDEDITQSLDKYCKEHRPNFRIYCSKSDAAADPERLKNAIVEKVKEDPALHDLIGWESLADRAASESVREIANLASGKALSAILTALAKGVVGKECTSPEQRQRGVHEALAQIHLDIMEQTQAPEPTAGSISEDILPESVRAALNTRLLTSMVTSKSSKEIPGSVFLLSDWHMLSRPSRDAGEIYNQWKQDYVNCLGKGKKIEEAHPVLIEVTPSCDVAQKKNYGLRLITGMLHPGAIGSNAPFLKCLGPILYQQKPYTLVLNSRAILGAVLEEPIPAPIFRLRHSALLEVQGWLAGMAARAGVISV